jgi:hypothetical protein
MSDLRRLGAFESGEEPWSSADWSRSGRVAGVAIFRVHADGHDRARVLELWATAAITTDSTAAPVETIQLTITVPHFGGVRWWARCRAVGSRRRSSWPPGRPATAVARARGSDMANERERAPARLLRRADKLRARLGEGGLWPIERARGSRRPKWMWRATYRRLLAEIDRLDGEAIARAVLG